MNVDRTESGPVTVLRLEGDIDGDGVNSLRVALLGCITGKRFNVVVNLSKIGFVSYMGVGVLVERLQQLRKAGGDIKLVGINLYTERLFRLAGVSSVFEIYDTEARAIAGFRQAA